jgi:hypothetical protein
MKLLGAYRWSLFVLLFLTALAKLLSAFGSQPILDLQDPILLLNNRNLLMVVSIFELAIGFLLISGSDPKFGLTASAALSTGFFIYRFTSWWFHVPEPCPCLGTIGGHLPVSRELIDIFLTMMLLYMLVGSVWFILCLTSREARLRMQPL